MRNVHTLRSLNGAFYGNTGKNNGDPYCCLNNNK